MSIPLSERIEVCPACHGGGALTQPGWPELRSCRTCEEHGVGDLVSAEVTDAVEAAARAARHLTGWRASQAGDLAAGRDGLEALRAVAAAAASAHERLSDELVPLELAACVQRGSEPA